MKKKPNIVAGAAELRRRAEECLGKRRRKQVSDFGDLKSAADAQRLLQELQVHQVELEMQNAALQEARDRTEALVEKYTDLYDFAPVGYFSLNHHGMILEVNLTGAALLGVERSKLIQRRLQRFVAPASRPAFVAFLDKAFASPARQVCEALLQTEDGNSFWADIHATSAVSLNTSGKWCRVAVSDITLLKRAEDAQLRLDALAVANREMKQEIVRRQAVETALKTSEREQIQLLEQSRHMQEQLRYLSHQILQAQEEERKRISRELHDEIVQTLVGINVHLEALVSEATINPKGLRQQIARTQRLVVKAVDIVHRFARELRPALLDDLGLIAALHSFMKDITKRTGIHVRFTTFAGVDQLPSPHLTVLYRVVQSALTNVAQHAQASRAEVTLHELPGAVCLEIKDNGKSFDVERVLHDKKNRRLGLLGMRERVEMVGGRFFVESAPNQGTTIQAQIPFNSNSAGGGGG